MIPHRRRGLVAAIAALWGTSTGVVAQQPGLGALPQPPAEQAPPQQQPPPDDPRQLGAPEGQFGGPPQQPDVQQPQPGVPQPQPGVAQPQPGVPEQQPGVPHRLGAPQQPSAAQQPGVSQGPTRLGNPPPGPVTPPPRKAEPGVYVGIVSPQQSPVTQNRLRTRGQSGGLGSGGSMPENQGGAEPLQ